MSLAKQLPAFDHSNEVSVSAVGPRDYQKFFELSTDLFVIVKPDGVVRSANACWQKLLGYSAEELSGIQLMTLVHPDDLERTSSAFQLLGSGSQVQDFENRYRKKSGGYCWLRWNSTFNGAEIYAVAREITEEVLARDKLKEANRVIQNALNLEREARAAADEQQERFRDFFAQAPMIAVVFSGPKQIIQLANPSFYTLVNYRNLMGRPVREAVTLDEGTSKILDRVYRAGERFVGRNFSIGADWAESGKNSEKLFHCIFEPIRDAKGQVDLIWCLLFDVTETVEMEAKLRGAERMASLGEMAAGVAHEINNPLGYTMISLELLQLNLNSLFPAGDLPAATKEILARATQGVERVQSIVKSLKSFTRNDESRMESVDLKAPLLAAQNFTSNETRHRAIVTTDFGEAPKALANEGRLTQVFINLIVNSAQAIEPGRTDENRINIRLFTSDDGKPTVEVQDTGCGIPASVIDRVFEPFYTSKPVGIGTGLGLSICHGIISGFGGEIHVNSAVGRGTTIRITLPAVKENTVENALERRPSAEPGMKTMNDHEKASKTRCKILIVDDDKLLRDVIVSALETDHEVVAVDSAVEALALFGEAPIQFDWIVCDLMMPQMTGMEFFERLKAREDGSEKKMIVMTGGAFTPAVRTWMDLLTNPKLEKPFRIRQLKQLLETL